MNFHDYTMYRALKEFLVKQGLYVEDSKDGGSLFSLPYDWRLDNRIAAVALALRLPVWREQYYRWLRNEFCAADTGVACNATEVERRIPYDTFVKRLNELQKAHPQRFTDRPVRDGQPPEVRFHLVAHSMGGLVAQYFIANLDGWKDVSRFITLGTPTKGATDSLRAFAEGEYPETMLSILFGINLMRAKGARFVSTSFPSMFQLLPRFPEAVSGLGLTDLGLADPRDLTPETFDRVYANYKKYAPLPDAKRIDVPASGNGPQSKDESSGSIFRRSFCRPRAFTRHWTETHQRRRVTRQSASDARSSS